MPLNIMLFQQGTDCIYQPAHPTLSSFVRASTLSLGSIAFGSLIVTLLELVKMLLNIARNNANADGHRKFASIMAALAQRY